MQEETIAKATIVPKRSVIARYSLILKKALSGEFDDEYGHTDLRKLASELGMSETTILKVITLYNNKEVNANGEYLLPQRRKKRKIYAKSSIN
jgi:hypothetical protein